MYKLKGINLKTYRSTKEIQRSKSRARTATRPAPTPTKTQRPVEKKTLTENEKQWFAAKIQDRRDEQIKKSFLGKSNPIYLTITAIVLIALFFVFVTWVVIQSS